MGNEKLFKSYTDFYYFRHMPCWSDVFDIIVEKVMENNKCCMIGFARDLRCPKYIPFERS